MGTHPIFESDFDCLTGFRRRCQLNWHAPTPPLSSTTTMLGSLATRSPPFSRPPTSNLNHSGHHSSLVPSRTSMSAARSLTSVLVLVQAQLPEVPPPLVVMLPLPKHQRKKPRPNPHPKKTTIWVSDFPTKSHASRLSGTSNKTIFQRSKKKKKKIFPVSKKKKKKKKKKKS